MRIILGVVVGLISLQGCKNEGSPDEDSDGSDGSDPWGQDEIRHNLPQVGGKSFGASGREFPANQFADRPMMPARDFGAQLRGTSQGGFPSSSQYLSNRDYVSSNSGYDSSHNFGSSGSGYRSTSGLKFGGGL